jgi:hypothetical protein
LGVIFDTSGTDDKDIRSRVTQARKCIACLNGILWSNDIRKKRTEGQWEDRKQWSLGVGQRRKTL